MLLICPCAAQTHMSKHAPHRQADPAMSYLPQRFTLTIGGALGNSYKVELQGKVLVYTVSRREEIEKTKQITPSPEQWKRFWKRMDQVHLWKWQARYDNSSMTDGTLWTLDIQCGHQRMISVGIDSYPGDKGVRQPVNSYEKSKVFTAFCVAVELLLGETFY
jgi:hypothetical protein